MKRHLFFFLFLFFNMMLLFSTLTAFVPLQKAMAQAGTSAVTLEGSKTVSIPDGIVAVAGEKLTVPVNVDNAADIAGMDLEIAFDPNILSLTDVMTTDLTEGFLVMFEDSGNGILWVSLAYHTGITPGTGALVYLNFGVLSKVTAYDSAEVSIENVCLYNEEPDPIEGIIG